MIQAWAERRIFDADADKANASGLVYLAVGGAAESNRAALPRRSRGPHLTEASANGGSHLVSPGPNKRSRDKDFLDSLPHDLETQEKDLRDAIHKFLAGWHSSAPPMLSELSQDRGVDAAMRDLLPRDVSLRAWCEARLSTELQLAETRRAGEYTIKAVKAAHRRAGDSAGERRSRSQGRGSRRSPSPAPTARPQVPLRPRSRSRSAHSRGRTLLEPAPQGARLAQRRSRSRSRSDSQKINVRMPHNESPLSPCQGEKFEAVVLRRPALSSGEPVWQAEIEMPQGGINHSGRVRTFNIRGPPRKTEEAAEEDCKQLTEASASGPKLVRQLANSMHRA